MRYQGGKVRIRKHLLKLIQSFDPKVYVEPFLGGCNVLPFVQAEIRIGSDINQNMVALFSAVQKGWVPPPEISEDLYKELKYSDDVSPLKGFVGSACSFAGRFFEGYARGGASGRNYAQEGVRALDKIRPLLKGEVYFLATSYEVLDIPEGSVVYCDPPYKGTKPYSETPKFDHVAFWEWVRYLSKSNVVLVSEYQAPPDFKVVWEQPIKKTQESSGAVKQFTEKVFRWAKT